MIFAMNVMRKIIDNLCWFVANAIKDAVIYIVKDQDQITFQKEIGNS